MEQMKNLEFNSPFMRVTTYVRGQNRPLDVEMVDSFAFKAGKGLRLAVTTADEIPLALAYDGLIGLAKVTAEDATSERIKDKIHAALTQFNVDPAKLEVYMGPCLTFSHTLVERALIESLMDAGYRACCKRTDGVDFLDVPVLVLCELRRLGVKMENIRISDYDTFENPDLLYSRLRGDKEDNLTVVTIA